MAARPPVVPNRCFIFIKIDGAQEFDKEVFFLKKQWGTWKTKKEQQKTNELHSGQITLPPIIMVQWEMVPWKMSLDSTSRMVGKKGIPKTTKFWKIPNRPGDGLVAIF